jgi:hypothetical protein
MATCHVTVNAFLNVMGVRSALVLKNAVRFEHARGKNITRSAGVESPHVMLNQIAWLLMMFPKKHVWINSFFSRLNLIQYQTRYASRFLHDEG